MHSKSGINFYKYASSRCADIINYVPTKGYSPYAELTYVYEKYRQTQQRAPADIKCFIEPVYSRFKDFLMASIFASAALVQRS